MPRCINCKQPLLDFAAAWLPEYRVDLPPKSLEEFCRYYCCEAGSPDLSGSRYPLVKSGPDGCSHHLSLQRGFLDGRIYLRLAAPYTSYLRHPWDIAMCTHKALSNGYYSRMMTVPEKARVACPWVVVDNDKAALSAGLERLGEWYRQHREELENSYQKQQGWIDKQDRAYRTARRFVDGRLEVLAGDQPAVMALYREVDRLAEEYDDAKKRGTVRYGEPRSFFTDWCSGKLPQPFAGWEEELAAVMMTGKKRVTDDPLYAHSFAMTGMLYFIHDAEKDLCPEVLTKKLWREG